jgi:hypothetical protein
MGGRAEGPVPRQAEPLGKQVTEAMDARAIAPHSDVLERAAALSGALGWPATTAQRVWAFGPDAVGPNLMVDATEGGAGGAGLRLVKDEIVAGFEWVCKVTAPPREPGRATADGVVSAGVDRSCLVARILLMSRSLFR